jgi:hypothetical protein
MVIDPCSIARKKSRDGPPHAHIAAKTSALRAS